MKQIELAQQLGVSKAYISMVMSGKKKPSKRITSSLNRLGVNQETVNFEAKKSILSHARLPVPTLPPDTGGLNILAYCLTLCANTQLVALKAHNKKYVRCRPFAMLDL